MKPLSLDQYSSYLRRNLINLLELRRKPCIYPPKSLLAEIPAVKLEASG